MVNAREGSIQEHDLARVQNIPSMPKYVSTLPRSILHTIAFGMYRVVCKGIRHDHVVCIFVIWYAFSDHV